MPAYDCTEANVQKGYKAMKEYGEKVYSDQSFEERLYKEQVKYLREGSSIYRTMTTSYAGLSLKKY